LHVLPRVYHDRILAMKLTLPDLPYARDALAPHMSEETLEYHHGKHHKTYVNETNKLIAGTEYQDMPLDVIVKQASGKLFNNAAQVWNHNFFWQCLTPEHNEPDKRIAEALRREFGGLQDFQKLFSETAAGIFGTGWAWLAQSSTGRLEILAAGDADNPMTQGKMPLLTCDVWEHAYYIDYRNARPDYLKAFWKLVNWNFVASNLALKAA
jgi:superoxide dismutase, Fe-Mn family